MGNDMVMSRTTDLPTGRECRFVQVSYMIEGFVFQRLEQYSNLVIQISNF